MSDIIELEYELSVWNEDHYILAVGTFNFEERNFKNSDICSAKVKTTKNKIVVSIIEFLCVYIGE